MHNAQFPTMRCRRLRSSGVLRDMVRETVLTADDFIYPIFVKAHINVPVAVSSMPGVFQWPLEQVLEEVERAVAVGVKAFLLFGIPEHKDPLGEVGTGTQGIVQQAILAIKAHYPDVLVIADVCLCEYTDHGHCGTLIEAHGEWTVDNDQTLALLAAQAVSLAEAGVDMVAPSGMIDGMVGAIRAALDEAGYSNLPILSYSVKYASSHYGPFREAAEGAPQKGDRRGYQMDPGNRTEALKEAALDIAEGADLLMVKPGLPYCDIIRDLTEAFPAYPTVAYQVSGEYSMIKAAAAQGWIDEAKVMHEQLLALKRAGARMIITYAAKEIVASLGANA